MNRFQVSCALILTLVAAPAPGQDKSMPGSSEQASEAAPAGDQPAFKTEELEQMLAPIALYPDSLLSQVLMASTYPIEVVEADRWTKANSALKGDKLTAELEKKEWDPSVKSLVNFPPVLAMMSENLSTTVKIGDAFIGQQKEVMDTVQKLRAKAKAKGNLESTKEQTVTEEPTDSGTQVIIIESSSPDVVYVPSYNPVVVYGSWPYPSYQPVPYYPPGYVATTALVSFGVGMACGAAWGYAWGNCNWGHGDVDIDIDRNTNINNNIDRSKHTERNKGTWKHDSSHRQGAAYRNQASADKVGAGRKSGQTAQTRDQYRGKAEAGRSDINRGGADSFKGPSASTRDRSGGQGAQNRSSAGSPKASQRSGTASGKNSAINSSNRSGSSERQASSRGNSSRSSSPSASRSSGSRSSGGASRGGGGGRGGGGRR